LTLWWVETYATLAWPWYCALGGIVSTAVAWVSSVLIDGFQKDYSPYTVHGQQEKFRREGLDEKHDGWYVVPGKVDRASYGLLAYFVACVAMVGVLYWLI
jgi:SSS family solute:Na+ symporter